MTAASLPAFSLQGTSGLPTLPPLAVAGAVLVLLAAAGGASRRLGYSVIPAYILVGLAVGPFAPAVGDLSLSLVRDPGTFRLLAELGVVLLLFFVGLELSLEQLFTNRAQFVRAGAADVLISAPIGVLIGLAFGWSLLESAFLALIVFNSSTVIIAKSLLDLGWIADAESDAILGVVVIEDVLTAAAFAVLSAVLLGVAEPETLLRSLGTAAAFVGVVVAIAHYGADRLERAFSTTSSELFLLGVLGVAALVAGLGIVSGVSEAVAAFFVGTAFGRTSHVQRIETLVVPVRDLSAALFFFAVGAATDPRLLAATALPVAVAVAVTVPGQLVSGYLAGRAYGLDATRAVRVGCALAPRGEFSLVIAAFLAAAGTTPVFRETLPAFTVGYVLVTATLGTVLMNRADDISRLAFGR
ncbi:cation:proton antiporter [Haloparvum alkalitolerans]|uniref:cation:proton antiporter n=1 Tax=Haloparvum alkalitolerans TaxID=1042953 RepID=UPI003CF02713